MDDNRAVNGTTDDKPSETNKTSPTDKISSDVKKFNSEANKLVQVKRSSLEIKDVTVTDKKSNAEINKDNKSSKGKENRDVKTNVDVSPIKKSSVDTNKVTTDKKSKIEVRKSADDVRLAEVKDRRSTEMSKSSIEINNEIKPEVRAITEIIKNDKKERSRSSSTEICENKRVSAEVSRIESRSRSVDDMDRYSVEVKRERDRNSKDYSRSSSIEESGVRQVEIRPVTVSVFCLYILTKRYRRVFF